MVFDVDGCLALGATPGGQGGVALPGAVELLTELQRRGVRIACCTNGAGRPPEVYAAGLRAVGLPVEDAEVITPPVVAAEHIAAGATVLVLGGEGVLAPLQRAGLDIVEPGARADVVLVGPMAQVEAAQIQAWPQASPT